MLLVAQDTVQLMMQAKAEARLSRDQGGKSRQELSFFLAL